ncbi:MAG: hypothetical protein JWM80_3026 [Cyanobacteria bacterium RYN_339]|nr:hypothetical protein [Cyanobacteria bacterium RYN_339]
MQTITEAARHPSPAPRPQSLTFDGALLWMGSIETRRIYAIRPDDWGVAEWATAPGKPWGMTAMGKDLRVLCGETDEDHRVIRRYRSDKGFEDDALPCPQDTGSQLGYDGTNLHVSQWYNRAVLVLDKGGKVIKTYKAPRGICGQVFVGGQLYLLTTAAEETNEYFLTRLDPKSGVATDVALVPFQGRALAHDGQHFWTNHREQHEIVAFTAAL